MRAHNAKTLQGESSHARIKALHNSKTPCREPPKSSGVAHAPSSRQPRSAAPANDCGCGCGRAGAPPSGSWIASGAASGNRLALGSSRAGPLQTGTGIGMAWERTLAHRARWGHRLALACSGKPGLQGRQPSPTSAIRYAGPLRTTRAPGAIRNGIATHAAVPGAPAATAVPRGVHR